MAHEAPVRVSLIVPVYHVLPTRAKSPARTGQKLPINFFLSATLARVNSAAKGIQRLPMDTAKCSF